MVVLRCCWKFLKFQEMTSSGKRIYIKNELDSFVACNHVPIFWQNCEKILKQKNIYNELKPMVHHM